MKKPLVVIFPFALSAILITCVENNMNTGTENEEDNNDENDMLDMDPSSPRDAPNSLQKTQEIVLPVGSEAVIKTDRREWKVLQQQ